MKRDELPAQSHPSLILPPLPTVRTFGYCPTSAGTRDANKREGIPERQTIESTIALDSGAFCAEPQQAVEEHAVRGRGTAAVETEHDLIEIGVEMLLFWGDQWDGPARSLCQASTSRCRVWRREAAIQTMAAEDADLDLCHC